MTARSRALVSRSALTANATRAALDGPGAAADLRRDAWGHGILAVAAALVHAGVTRAVADERAREAVAATGLRIADGDADTIDMKRVLGLPGTDGEPAMRLIGDVLSTKPLRAGEGVSYGYTHRASTDTTVALVSGGYGQGVVRALGNRARVEIDGMLHPIVGRVAMDVCMVDIGDAHVAPGSHAVFFGGHGPARGLLGAWMAATGLTAEELACAVGLHAAREDEP